MKFKAAIKQGLILSLISLFFSVSFSFLIGEFIVKHIFPQDTYQIARSVGINFFEDSPIIPVTLQKNVTNFHHIGYTHEFDHYVNTNSWGTRGKDFGKEKPSNTYRILVLGDSMTFGWGVEDDETYSFLLEEELNNLAKSKNISRNFEVINAGFTSGRTLDSYYVYLKEVGIQFDPDLIIVTLFPYNDLTDLLENSWEAKDEKGYPTKIISLKEKVEDGYLVSRQKTKWKYEIPFFRNSHLAMLFFNALERGSPATVQKIKKILGVVEEKEDFSLEERLRCLYSLAPQNCPPALYKIIEQAKFLLLGFKDYVTQEKKGLLVTIMSSPDQAVPLSKKVEKEKKLEDQQPQKYFKDFLAQNKIEYLDFLLVITEPNAQKFFYERDGHFTKEGHLQIAKALSKFLEPKLFP
jgi:hypothetical protein